MIKTSEKQVELSKALNALQGDIRGAKADSLNPFFKSKYADLESVWHAIRDPLKKHGLAIMQLTSHEEGMGWFVVTRVMHVSGEWIEGYFPIVVAKDKDPQSFGSAVSYARRYSLAAAVGVYEIDDDAELAMERYPQPKPPSTPPKLDPIPKIGSKPQTSLNLAPKPTTCSYCGTPMVKSKTGNFYCSPCYKKKLESKPVTSRENDDIPF